MKKYKPVDILEELRVYIIRKYKSQAEAARVWGVSRAYVSIVLAGKKNIPDYMLKEAGFRRVEATTHYVKA